VSVGSLSAWRRLAEFGARRSKRYLADLSAPEAAVVAGADAVLAVPVGATEQHGPHLPLATDTLIAEELVRRLMRCRPEVVAAPALSYGSSGEHEGFAGTISIGQQVTELLLVELGRSASATFPRILFVSAHGGNALPVARAVALLQREGRDARAFSPRFGGDAHAGRTESSLLLALAPRLTSRASAEAGATEPLEQLFERLRQGGVASVSVNGVLGDPAGANRREGSALLGHATAELVRFVESWTSSPGGGS
jgi:creatinine amidohydrolase